MLHLVPLFAQAANSGDDAAAGVFGLLGLGCIGLIGLLIYFVPSFIAGMRGHQNALAIFILNLLLGWSFLGWIAALVWSFTAVERPYPSRGYYPPRDYDAPRGGYDDRYR